MGLIITILFVWLFISYMVWVFILLTLAIEKKKLNLYVDEIYRNGPIVSEIRNIKFFLDPLLPFYIFYRIPKRNAYPSFYTDDKFNQLAEKIKLLEKSCYVNMIIIGVLIMVLVLLR